MTAWAAFHAGGYFVGTTAVLVVVLLGLLLLRLTLASYPLAGLGPELLVAAVALGLFAVWTLASAGWSHAPARAAIEFDRVLLYLLVLVLLGTVPFTPARVRWVLRGLALASVSVCLAAFVSRTLPDLLATPPSIASGRLSYPITYWNALGLLAALTAILSLHLSSSEQEPRTVRVMGAAALPLAATTVYLTFSRGAIAAGALGMLTYLALGRPRLFLSAALAGVPAAVIAVRVAYHAPALATDDPTGAAAIAQGHHVAVAVGSVALAAAAVRAGLMLLLDKQLLRLFRPRPRWRWLARASFAAGVAATVVALVAAGAPAYAERQLHAFAAHSNVHASPDLRDRLTDPSSSSRIHIWRIALRAFESAPTRGHGAGTYEIAWNRHRPYEEQVFDGHSVVLEPLAELGVVGLALLAIALGTMLAAMLRRARGPDRALFAVTFAVALTWLVHASIDWDWEMPVLTLGMFALGGAVMATPARPGDARTRRAAYSPSRLLRVVAGIGLVVLAVMPVRMALSQHHLNRAASEFGQGDCRRTIDAALDSIDALGGRPEPYELLTYCNIRLGDPSLGSLMAGEAVARDPDSWRYRYALAVARAAEGLDPRPSAREALRLNPREPVAVDAARRFDTEDPGAWRDRVTTAPLPPEIAAPLPVH